LGAFSPSYWGNGEFVLGMPDLTQAEIETDLSDFLTLLRQQIFIGSTHERFQVGVAWAMVHDEQAALSVDELYQRAVHNLCPCDPEVFP
jgi:hypothetical protein